MADLALAQIDDLVARMGHVSAERARAALEDVSNVIHQFTGNVWVDSETGGLVDDIPPVVRTICCAAARRVLENPQGVVSESLGEYSVTVGGSSNDVYLSRSEMRLLRRAAGGSGISTVELETPYQRVGDVFVPVAGSSEGFPMGPFPSA